MSIPRPMLPEEFSTHRGAKRRFSGGGCVPSQDAERTSEAALSEACSDCGVSTCVDQGEIRFASIPITRSQKSSSRSALGLSDLQHPAVAQTGVEAKHSSHRIIGKKAAVEPTTDREVLDLS